MSSSVGSSAEDGERVLERWMDRGSKDLCTRLDCCISSTSSLKALCLTRDFARAGTRRVLHHKAVRNKWIKGPSFGYCAAV